MNIAKKAIVEGAITFTWADESISTVLVDDFSKAIRERAEVHGFSQKLGDSYSGCKTVAEAKLKFDATLKALHDGDWNMKGASTGGQIVQAIARATGATIEDVLVKWNEADDATRKSWAKHPDVIQAALTIKLEGLKAKVENAEPLSI
jgi:hypothetical protein